MHVISDEHLTKLRKLIGLDVNDDIPEDVEELYWHYERCCRRLGRPVEDEQLISVVVTTGRNPAPPVTFIDLVKEGKVAAGEQVLAKFRKEWKFGTFKKIKGNKIIVQVLDDSAEDREFVATDVRLPTREEMKVLA